MKDIKIVEPIRNKSDLKNIMKWFQNHYPKYAILFLIGISSGLRISDILNLNVENIYKQDYITIREQKTGKYKKFPIKEEFKPIFNEYCKSKPLNQPLFLGRCGCRLDRSQVYRFINRACEECGVTVNVGTHTMRKTFGYHHYKQFHDIALLQTIFNHSSPTVTKRYIGITQDEINISYISLNLFEDAEQKPKITGRTKLRKVESYLNNYLKNGATRHKDFALDILEIIQHT